MNRSYTITADISEVQDLLDRGIISTKEELLCKLGLDDIHCDSSSPPVIENGLTLWFVAALAQVDMDWRKEITHLHIRHKTPIVYSNIRYLENIEVLKLYRCGVIELPESLGELTKLRVLNLAFNEITTLPSSITKLLCLEELSIAGNPIDVFGIPEGINQLSNLKILVVWLSLLDSKSELLEKIQNSRVKVIGYKG